MLFRIEQENHLVLICQICQGDFAHWIQNLLVAHEAFNLTFGVLRTILGSIWQLKSHFAWHRDFDT